MFINYMDIMVVAGIHPAPRSWMSWNFEALEPAEIKSLRNLLKKSVIDQPKRKHSLLLKTVYVFYID